MKEIYLIRHTTPAVPKGVCYGQTDLDVTAGFDEEAAIISRLLPAGFMSVHSSPLSRCARLAARLFPEHSIRLHPRLMEIHCGEWEMKGWDDLPREAIDPWMKDFVNIRIPGGESYLDLHARVTGCFNEILADGITDPAAITNGQTDTDAKTSENSEPMTHAAPKAIIAHGGVIRSILSHITGTPLIDSFKVFSLHYGCVIRVYGETESLQYEVISNIAPAEREQHKPKSFY